MPVPNLRTYLPAIHLRRNEQALQSFLTNTIRDLESLKISEEKANEHGQNVIDQFRRDLTDILHQPGPNAALLSVEQQIIAAGNKVFLCIATFLAGQHPWDKFQTYLDEDIRELSSLKENLTATHTPASSGSALLAVGTRSGVLAGAVAGATLAFLNESSLGIGCGAFIGGVVGGAVASIAKRAAKT
jgi:hypothetical protein